MNRQLKQVLAAIILGGILPRLMLGIGSAGQTLQKPESTQPTTQSQTEQVQDPENEILVSVQFDDGKTIDMELETYVLGVVLAEMPASFDIEALKAQAIVSRTYALRRMLLRDKHEVAAICTNSTCCQAYISKENYLQGMGDRPDIAKVSQAVRETQGQVITYGGQLAEATYFSCSGGRTEAAAAVWGENIVYLQSVDSPGEENAQSYTGSVHFTANEFCAALGRELAGDPSSWLGKVTYTEGDGVDMMFIGGLGYSGTQLRQLLVLNSTAFTMVAENGGITVTTRGKGHRVGMSQYGADAMAVVGSDVIQILSHYYPGTEIDKVEDIE